MATSFYTQIDEHTVQKKQMSAFDQNYQNIGNSRLHLGNFRTRRIIWEQLQIEQKNIPLKAKSYFKYIPLNEFQLYMAYHTI
jgi:hypothetical protein